MSRLNIGADPEFELRYGPNHVQANWALDNIYWMRFANLGMDHHPATGEVRPPYKSSPEAFVQSLHNTFLPVLAAAQAVGISIYGGGMPFQEPLGGHFHF